MVQMRARELTFAAIGQLLAIDAKTYGNTDVTPITGKVVALTLTREAVYVRFDGVVPDRSFGLQGGTRAPFADYFAVGSAERVRLNPGDEPVSA